MKLWVSNIVFVEIVSGDFPTPLLTICNMTGWKGLGEWYCKSIWFPPGSLMTSSRQSDRDLGHKRVWFAGFKANVSPASFGSVCCYSVLDAATVQSTAWPAVCAHTPPHPWKTNIWNYGPRAHGIAVNISLTSRSSFVVVSQIAGAPASLEPPGTVAIPQGRCRALLWVATAQQLSETHGAVRRWFTLQQACEKREYTCQLLGPDQICSSHLSLLYSFCPLDMAGMVVIFLKKAFQSFCFQTKCPHSVNVLLLTMPACGGGKLR